MEPCLIALIGRCGPGRRLDLQHFALSSIESVLRSAARLVATMMILSSRMADDSPQAEESRGAAVARASS